MNKPFKPDGYNSVSPYFIVDGADRFIRLMQQIFDAKMLREYRMLSNHLT
jgi:PhnB protein